MPVVLSSSGGGSITLDAPSTAASRTLTLPDATGTVALTSDAKCVVLGTISTASGSSASLGSLNLTTYRVLQLWVLGVSNSLGGTLLVGNSTSDDVAFSLSISAGSDVVDGIVSIDLTDGVGVSTLTKSSGTPAPLGVSFTSPITTASTTISVACTSGNFDAGSIRVVAFR